MFQYYIVFLVLYDGIVQQPAIINQMMHKNIYDAH